MRHDKYELSESLDRMTRILDGNGEAYRHYTSIPSEEELREYRGCYVECVVIVCKLTFYERSVNIQKLAKIYDIYLGELNRILSEHYLCRKVVFRGNTVVGIYNTGLENFMSELMDIAGRASSLPDVINVKIGRRDNQLFGNICAMDRGVQYTKQINGESEYFGGLLNKVDRWISHQEDEKEKKGLYVSARVYSGLKEDYKAFFKETDIDDVLFGKIENIGMARWIKEQK